ncbi:MAG: hypothetical protein HOV81_00195 [Kofleriaceae bacterium]|nr:hypothetical protein [Kofleriaceae bacterium]
MAREQYTERQSEPQAVAPAAAPPAESSSTGTFVTQGPIPPVETSGGPATSTASERAFGTADTGPEPGGLRGIISRRELVVGDPADPASGYIVVSQKQGGAKWKTADGSFTGTADKNGLDTQYRLGEHDALHGHVGKDKTATLAWERDGKNQGELYGRYGSAHDYEAGARRQFELGGGTLTAGARHRVDAAGATDGVFGTYHKGATTADASLGVRDGQFAGSGSIATTLGRDQLSGSIAHDGRGTTLDARDLHDFGRGYTGVAQIHHGPEGTTGMLGGAYKDANTQIDGNITRGLDRTSLHLGGTQQVSPQLSVSGALDHVRPDHGASQSTLSLSERYRSGDVIHGANLELGHGARDYMKATGSLDAKLAPNIYGGVWGGSEIERGHQASAQLGASLTFSTNEKSALTLAGVLDQDGRLETRLQFDLFKSKIESIGDLDREKKNALVSVFLSYSQAGNRHTLDQRFGEPQIQTNVGNQVTAGIKIKF